MKARRHVCPECGRSIADTGPVYWTAAPHRPYVYLRPHKRLDGTACPCRSTRAVTANPDPVFGTPQD